MSVAYILDFSEATLAQYHAVNDAMGVRPGALPDGLVYHAAGPRGGGLRVVDIWESAAHFQRFGESRLFATLRQQGLAAPHVQQVDVAMTRLGEGHGRSAELLQVVRLDGLDQEGFSALDGQVLPTGEAPAGCGFHVNGPTETGWIVIDTWTSRAIRDAFLAERVQPAMAAAGKTEPPVIEDIEVAAILTPEMQPAASAR